MSCWGENVFHPGFSCVRCAYTGDQFAATRTKTVRENLRIAAGISSSVALSMAGTTSLSALSGWWEQRRARAQRERLTLARSTLPLCLKKGKGPIDCSTGPSQGCWGETLSRHAWCRFRGVPGRWCFDGFSALRLRGAQQSYRLLPANWHGQVFALARERQTGFFLVKIDADQVANVDLFGRQEI